MLKSQKEKSDSLNRENLNKILIRDDLEKELNELNQKIGAIEERHRRSRDLQKIANLLDNPSGTNLTPENFNILSLKLLTVIRDYTYTHSGINTQYERHVKTYVDNAVNFLNSIVSGKL